MGVKWNDTTERMMLLKLLEQNPTLKLNINDAIEKWPSGWEKPTSRSIGDRFNLLKKQVRDSTVKTSLGLGSGGLSAAIPPTPTSVRRKNNNVYKNNAATPRSDTTERVKLKPNVKKIPEAEPVDTDDDDDEEEELDRSDYSYPIPDRHTSIADFKGSSSSQFTSRLLGDNHNNTLAATSPVKNGSKINRKAKKRRRLMNYDVDDDDEKEESMTECESESDDAEGAGEVDSHSSAPHRTARASVNRQPSIAFEDFADIDGTDGSLMSVLDAEIKKGRLHTYERDADDDSELEGEGEDSDGSFDHRAYSAAESKEKGRKQKKAAGWRERIARRDG